MCVLNSIKKDVGVEKTFTLANGLGECTRKLYIIYTDLCFPQVQLINDAYNLVIDSMLGLEVDPSNIKEPYFGILVTLKQIKIPIVSVDVPSGKLLIMCI